MSILINPFTYLVHLLSIFTMLVWITVTAAKCCPMRGWFRDPFRFNSHSDFIVVKGSILEICPESQSSLTTRVWCNCAASKNHKHRCFSHLMVRLGVLADACQGSKPMLKKKRLRETAELCYVLRSVWWWHVVMATVGFEVWPVQTTRAQTLGQESIRSPSHSIWR